MSEDANQEKINPAIVSCFVKATQNVLSTMLGIESKLDKPQLSVTPRPTYDVSGIVAFTGEVAGSVVISFSEETALKIVEAFTMEKVDLHSEDFVDAIGELCNMIAGNAKKDFNLDARIGIPSVIIGKCHLVSRLKDVPCVVIPCSCDAGEFTVEVNIKQIDPVPAGGTIS
ncbi:MAG: chemotaxis protein CheX [Planctomycetes bacterium]|nr:chemotaxis protein CheX [Planctomycetota bacterium]